MEREGYTHTQTRTFFIFTFLLPYYLSVIIILPVEED